ncbi:MAG TPA: MarR family winged helix-turn-helix transcriptional regulator [Eoetvoesiella sp.]|jgi:DNA-binding MarR family transcriptional regulator|uniref:MarR family winged helix-turn-helix transcriptional regulator n=1 Tax=Eoetvoesiella sp. TaxID=1966355 RepID=UPI002BF7E322|nr:MarR family winged helix-turn-helix transcriptional regulator [Eoetvoesiella sp.]HWK63147.1 MarR family winged helix-turn-helix transcriptional regulator [Eoetvoesiella sp.]
MPIELPAFKVVQQLGRTYRAMLSSFDASMGLPLPRWRILLALYQQGQMSQKHLAEQLGMDPAALTRQVKAMQNLDLIARHNDERDNRLTNVVLTGDGVRLVEQALPKRMEFFGTLVSDLSSEEVETLSRLLDILEKRLRSETPRP